MTCSLQQLNLLYTLFVWHNFAHKLLILVDVFKKGRQTFRKCIPSALKVSVMYVKLPKEILMLMERIRTLCPVIVYYARKLDPFFTLWFIHYSLPTLRVKSEFRDQSIFIFSVPNLCLKILESIFDKISVPAKMRRNPMMDKREIFWEWSFLIAQALCS